MLIIVAAVLGALGAAGVGAVVAGLTGAAVGAVGGALASIAHMVILTRQTRTPGALTWPAILAAVFCGVVAGIFYAFSSAVMQSLAMQPGAAGMAVMQTINVVVFNPWFGFAFSATPGSCAASSSCSPATSRPGRPTTTAT